MTAPDADALGPHLHADLCAEALTRQCFDATGAPLLGHLLRADPFSLQRFYDRMDHRKRGGDPWATRLLHPWFSSSSDAQRTSLALVQDPADAQVPTMPNAALALLQPDFLLTIAAMRLLLAELDAPPC